MSANPDVAALVRARWRLNETSTACGIAAPRVVAADHVLRNGTAAARGCDQASTHWVRLSPASDCKRPIEFRPAERRKARSATTGCPLSIGVTSADRTAALLCGFCLAISMPPDWTGCRLEYRSFFSAPRLHQTRRIRTDLVQSNRYATKGAGSGQRDLAGSSGVCKAAPRDINWRFAVGSEFRTWHVELTLCVPDWQLIAFGRAIGDLLITYCSRAGLEDDRCARRGDDLVHCH